MLEGLPGLGSPHLVSLEGSCEDRHQLEEGTRFQHLVVGSSDFHAACNAACTIYILSGAQSNGAKCSDCVALLQSAFSRLKCAILHCQASALHGTAMLHERQAAHAA